MLLKSDLLTYDDMIAVWGLFFESFQWLKDVSQDGKPPILIGSVLHDIVQDGTPSHRRGHLALIHQGVPRPYLLKSCLKPHAMHSHGRVVQCDYAFESHNITLNIGSAMTGSIANATYTRWPERLSVVSGQTRQCAYLEWGGNIVKSTGAIVGLGQNKSVSRICHIGLQGHKPDMGVIFCRNASLLYTYDSRQSCYKYSSNYKQLFRRYALTLLNRDGPDTDICDACIMKGDETLDIL